MKVICQVLFFSLNHSSRPLWYVSDLNIYWMETIDFNFNFLFSRLQTKVTIIPLAVGSNTQASPGNKRKPKLQAAKPSKPVVRIKPKPLPWWVWIGETKIVTTLAPTLQLMPHPPGPKSNSRYVNNWLRSTRSMKLIKVNQIFQIDYDQPDIWNY